MTNTAFPPYGKLLVSAAGVVGGFLYLQNHPDAASPATPTPQPTGGVSIGLAQRMGDICTQLTHVSLKMIPSAVHYSEGGFLGWLWSVFQSKSAASQDIDHLLENPSEWLDCIPSLMALLEKAEGTQQASILRVLSVITEHSVTHADRVASHGVGAVVTQLLEKANRHRQISCSDLSKLSVALIRGVARMELLEIEKWVRPWIVLLADGLMAEDITYLQSALNVLTALVNSNYRKVIHTFKRSPSLWPLLKKLSQNGDSEIQIGTAALAEAFMHAGMGPGDATLSFWEDTLLKWVMTGSSEISQIASRALKGLRCGDPGVALAKKWLSQALHELSHHPEVLSIPLELREPWVIPSYMRYVADEIVGHVPSDPPEHPDMHHHTSFLEPLMLDWKEDVSQDTPISRGISILCDFAADSAALCSWLMNVDVLTPCRLLMQLKPLTIKEEQQIARLIALLAQREFRGSSFVEWLPWLHRSVQLPDLCLASHAVRSLLHIQQGQADIHQHHPSFPDGIHFFNPDLDLSHTLLWGSGFQDGTVADVVFVHGIRGGPFVTWRSEGSSEAHHSRESCWPSHWLPVDLPEARLISVQFAAPVSSWEGGSGPLQHTAWTLLSKLREAGIGSRPTIFVAHSMGGLIVKELLLKAMEDPVTSELGHNTYGMVFISTPHHGAWLAQLAWGLRHLGAYPAPSFNTMKPGPYLEQLNTRIRDWVRRQEVEVLNFAETLATDISAMMPRVTVVTKASAFPGFGAFVALHGRDHITTCKPTCRTAPFYRHFLSFVKNRIQHLGKTHL